MHACGYCGLDCDCDDVLDTWCVVAPCSCPCLWDETLTYAHERIATLLRRVTPEDP